MHKNSIKLIAVIGAGLLTGLPAAQADSNDGLLANYRMFQLENNDVQTVIRSQKTKAYRVCVEDKPGSVPLRVSHSEGETIVEPGECQLIETSKIKMAAVGNMPLGMTMIGHFTGNRSDAKKYSTTITVAKADRD
ncbi:MAG: hypothetical protein WAU48_15365 [Gammaproteobacteria bacterium]